MLCAPQGSRCSTAPSRLRRSSTLEHLQERICDVAWLCTWAPLLERKHARCERAGPRPPGSLPPGVSVSGISNVLHSCHKPLGHRTCLQGVAPTQVCSEELAPSLHG
jgi:hypothetical protein